MVRALVCGVMALGCAATAAAESRLIEAESFENPGGWKLDTQFIRQMGSPYLLAHGLGRPVEDAATTVDLPAGTYRSFARTIDWTAPWDADGSPGRFTIAAGGSGLGTFGDSGPEWAWQPGESFEHAGGPLTITLHDETGFDGRCDAVYLTTEDTPPPESGDILPDWRREALGLGEPAVRDGYDLVVIGGGYAGMGSALSAARMGCKVALIQDRGVLGGNGSSEVRVWSMGLIRRGKFPRIGEIIQEFADEATKSPGKAEEFGDDLKERVVRAEPNIDLFLNSHAYEVTTGEGGAITSVTTLDTRTSERSVFRGRLFADCTGHGTIGALAGADADQTPGGRMGMSNMWAWSEVDNPPQWPATPWALPLTMDDFPYPRRYHGQWFWESGFDKDPIGEAEAIRDWNLRAVFGAFTAMKTLEPEKHARARLDWVAYIGGPRESRRLMGDVVLTQEDIVSKREFPDGCVPSTWSIDLHYPKREFSKKFPSNPFISVAVHDRRVDRSFGYPVPYRCFYSRNVPNLFMAGRNVSVTHEALGTVRVMRTCGMMGEVVGRAASVCVAHDTSPRGVYDDYLYELLDLLRLPGKARRATVDAEISIPSDALPLAGPNGPPKKPTGLDPAEMRGVVVDDAAAKRSGTWTESAGLTGYVGFGYRYTPAGSGAWSTFTLRPETAGRYEIRLAYRAHENRSTAVPVSIEAGTVQRSTTLDMTREPNDEDGGTVSLGEVELLSDTPAVVTVRAAPDGVTCIDAAQLVAVP